MTPHDALVNALRAKEYHEAWRASTGLVQQPIDNVAVLFSDELAQSSFLRHCVDLGWRVFNSSNDHVRGHLSAEDYDVQFTFLRDPDNPDFRIESMYLEAPWQSAIHSDLLKRHGQGCTAQGSYKPNGENSLAAYQDENRLMMGLGFQIVECFSAEYGLYTYLKPLADHDIYPLVDYDLSYGYLKVRLNTRDAS